MRNSRAISNAIAGLIIITFILVTLVPLMIEWYTSSSALASKIGNILAEKIKKANPQLNVSLVDWNDEQGEYRYIIENQAPLDTPIVSLFVQDTNSDVYLIKPLSAYNNWLTLPNGTQVTIRAITPNLVQTRLQDKSLILAPGAAVEVVVRDGELLSVATPFSTEQVVNAAVRALEAEVARAIRAQFVYLLNITSLQDIFQLEDVVITTDLNATEDNISLLDQGFIKSTCYTGSRWNLRATVGGFQRESQIAINRIALIDWNLAGGSIFIGGSEKLTNYGDPPYKVSMLMPFYMLAEDSSTPEPSIFYIEGERSEKILCMSYESRTFCWYTGTNAYKLASRLSSSHILTSSEITSVRPAYNMFRTRLSIEGVIFSPLILGVTAYDSSTGWSFWCAPGAISAYSITNKTIYIISSRQSPCFLLDGSSLYMSTNGTWTITIDSWSILEQNATNDLIYAEGQGGELVLSQDSTQAGDLASIITFTRTIEPDQASPIIRLKTESVNIYKLSIRDGLRGYVGEGVRAFGVYFYSGQILLGYEIPHKIIRYLGTGGYFKLFSLVPNTLAGLDPFMVVADLDVNGIPELVFSTEEFYPGWRYTYDDVSDIDSPRISDDYVGCREETVGGPLFIKLVGRYAIDSEKVGQVAVQIRYYFHETSGDDTNNIEDPKRGLFGFYLVDENGTIRSSREYIFQELDDKEDTWPPNRSYLVEDVYLPVPEDVGTLYVAYGVQDPYGAQYTYDDMEYTVAIEWIATWFIYR